MATSTYDSGYLTGTSGSGRSAFARMTVVATDNGASVAISASVQAFMKYAYQWDTYTRVTIGSRGQVTTGPYRLGSNPGSSYVAYGTPASDSVTINKTQAVQSITIRGNISASGFAPGTSGDAVATVSIPAYFTSPAAPTGVSNTRNSDSKNTVSWTRSSSGSGTYSSQVVQRSVDGGAWSDLATIAADATSYADSSTQANHSYSYRIKAQNSAGSAISGASNTTYNTPAAPTNISAARIDATTVRISFDNPAFTDTKVNLRVGSSPTGPWTTIDSAAQGSGLTEVSHAPGGGTFYYQVQLARATPVELSSSWSSSSAPVVTITPPAAPTLTGPVSGTVVSLSSPTVRIQWTHNPLDGSDQVSAQVDISIDGGASWETSIVLGKTAYLDMPVAWPVNSTVSFRARTRGAHATYSPYSSSRSFTVRQVPQAVITEPDQDGGLITMLPMLLAWSYTDQSGSQQSAQLSVRSDTGQLLWQRVITGAQSEYVLEASEFLPANNSSYTLSLTVTSTSTLTATTSRAFTTEYTPPAAPEIYIDIDSSLSAVRAMLVAGLTDSNQPPTVSLGLFRENPDSTLLDLGQGLASGSAVIDRFAPFDTELTYVAAAYTSYGLSNTTRQSLVLPSHGRAAMNYGPGCTEVAKLSLDMSWNRSLTHTRETVATAGTSQQDSYPLVFYGAAKQSAGTLNGTVVRDTDAFAGEDRQDLVGSIEALADWTGSVVLRLPYSAPVMAAVTVSMGVSDHHFAQVAITWEQVRAHGLAL